MRITRQVEGLTMKMPILSMRKSKIDVKLTADKLGKTLSLCDGETMLTIPLEALKDVIEVKEVNN